MPVLPTTAHSRAEDALTLARAGEIHPWRQYGEAAARRVCADLGMARGQDQLDPRDAIHHSACALRCLRRWC